MRDHCCHIITVPVLPADYHKKVVICTRHKAGSCTLAQADQNMFSLSCPELGSRKPIERWRYTGQVGKKKTFIERYEN